jgi:hypothetical protein
MGRLVAVSESPVNRVEPNPRRAGSLERAAVLGVVLLISGLAYVLVLVFQPQNLADIRTGNDPVNPIAARDLTKVFSQSIEGSYALRLSEDEINAYLAKTLAVKQGGALGGMVTLEKVLVRLETDRAEVIMVRKIGGWPMTTSMWVAVNQTENAKGEIETHIDLDGGPMPVFSFVSRGGRFGKLVVPQGFLLLVRDSFAGLAAQYPEEIRLGFEEMSRIRIEKGALVLDPRFDQTSGLMDF